MEPDEYGYFDPQMPHNWIPDDRTEADSSMWWTVENGNPCGQFPKCNNCGTEENECIEFQKWYESGNYVEEDDVAI